MTSTPERKEDKPVQATASVTTAHTQVLVLVLAFFRYFQGQVLSLTPTLSL